MTLTLPTAPYTVIRVMWRYINRDGDLIRRNDGDWQHAWGDGRKYTQEDLVREVEGYEVLAAPQMTNYLPGNGPEQAVAFERLARHQVFNPVWERDGVLYDQMVKVLDEAVIPIALIKRETAKAVLDRVREEMEDALFRYPKTRDLRLEQIAREFGVES